MASENAKDSRFGLSRLLSLVRMDGWVNTLTGLATGRDARTASAPNTANRLSYADCEALWSTSDTAQRIVDIPAEEMLREGFDLTIPDAPEAAERIGAQFDDLMLSAKLLDMVRKTRAFGGAVALMGVDDGASDLSEPLDLTRSRGVRFLTVFDPSEFSVLEWEGGIGSPNYGEPLIYSINPRIVSADARLGAGVLSRVHASRVLRMTRPFLTRIRMQGSRGVGDSVFETVWEVIRDFDTSHHDAAALIKDFAQAVFKIKGLAEAVASDNAGLIRERMMMMDLSRSVLRAIALDAETEDFERKPTPVSGLSDILDRLSLRVAAATRIPVTRLMGQAPAGLNATGDADARNFYDFIHSEQTALLTPVIERLTRALMLSRGSPTRGIEPENWTIVYRPLWQPSQKEQADTRGVMAQADAVYFDRGVLSAEEIRQARFGGDTFKVDTSIESDDLEDDRDLDETAEGEGVDRLDPEGNPIAVMPGETGAGGAPKLQDTALNGAQITSAIEIVKSVGRNELSRESGAAMLVEFFNLDPARAERILGPRNFKPEPSPAEQAAIARAENPAPIAAPPQNNPRTPPGAE